MAAFSGQPGFSGMDSDDERYEAVRARLGHQAADEIGAIADRAPTRVPTRLAWRWAEQKWEERQLAAEAGTGYDPDEEYRKIPNQPEETAWPPQI